MCPGVVVEAGVEEEAGWDNGDKMPPVDSMVYVGRVEVEEVVKRGEG